MLGTARTLFDGYIQACSLIQNDWIRPDDEGFVEEARKAVLRTLEHSSKEEVTDYGMLKEKIRADLKRYINRNTQRRPLIIPVIVEI